MRNLLKDALPGFEFPRVNLFDYNIDETIKPEDEVTPDEFIIGILWDNTLDEDDMGKAPLVMVEGSVFAADLTSEEINIDMLLIQSQDCREVPRKNGNTIPFIGK